MALSHLLLLVLVNIAVSLLYNTVQGQRCGCNPQKFRREAAEGLGNGTRLEGDIVLTRDDDLLFEGKFRASIEASRRWPNGQLFYEASRMNGNAQNKIRQALAALSQATGNCVRFTEVQPGHRGPHVTVFSGNGCFSMIGRTGGRQDLSLGDNNNCLSDFGVIQHEFMHALGFHHEQTRRDRDQHIRVNWGNIDSNQCSNFRICQGCTLTTQYDLRSIMQYASWLFSCRRGATTMLTMNNQQIPYNAQLQPSDVTKIKKYYGCN